VGEVGCPWADGWSAYLGSPDKGSHPYAAPINATRLAGVAPALVITAEDDPLRDESETYAYNLKIAGVSVQHETLPAPTGWPFVLSAATNDAMQSAPWSATVVDRLKTFFASAARTKRALASAHPASA
jgi:acetyl esterase